MLHNELIKNTNQIIPFLNRELLVDSQSYNEEPLFKLLLIQIEFSCEIGLGPSFLNILEKHQINIPDKLLQDIKALIVAFEQDKVNEFNKKIHSLNPNYNGPPATLKTLLVKGNLCN